MKNIFKLLAFLPLLTACDDLFEPALENNRDLEAMHKEPSYAQGILANAYIILPYETSPTSDLATDDAVTNEISSNYLRMATGSWTANNNPVSQWQNRFNAILYINLFLENVDKVEWAKDERISTMFLDRLKGEAYGLRALHMYYLLRAHGGKIADGTLMGVPIILKSEGPDADFNHARATYSDCVKQIMEDAGKAIELLPLDYKKFADSEIPEKYRNIGVTNASDYRRVCGEEYRGLMSGRIALAVRAQTALLAASPAFQSGSGMTWEQAADYAAEIIEKANGGGGCGLDADGLEWYTLADKDYGTAAVPPRLSGVVVQMIIIHWKQLTFLHHFTETVVSILPRIWWMPFLWRMVTLFLKHQAITMQKTRMITVIRVWQNTSFTMVASKVLVIRKLLQGLTVRIRTL